ncbi:MAG: hypothetical protein PHU23_17370 [Dehalococcoidales bacterium]|nr:hypothetical protein [Dehalococcoidales bacterium]
MIKDNDQIKSISDLVGAPRCTYVTAYTYENMYKGYIVHSVEERFLDVLNHGSVEDKRESAGEFLFLNDVEVYTLDGKKKDATANCLLNKNSTLVIAESRITAGELPPSKPFSYLSFQRKKAAWVNIMMRNLCVTGQVYIGQDQESISLLDLDQMYIPVTRATMVFALWPDLPKFDFLAVNKDRIVSILELPPK